MRRRNLIFPFLCLLSVSFNFVLINKLHAAHERLVKNKADIDEIREQLDHSKEEVIHLQRKELENSYLNEAEIREQHEKDSKKLRAKCPPCMGDAKEKKKDLAPPAPKQYYRLSFEGIRERVRKALRLDEPIVISTESVHNCNQMCSNGLSRCAPKCIFTSQPDEFPHIDACTFESQLPPASSGNVGNGRRCLQVGTGMESEAIYPTMARARHTPRVWTASYRLDSDAPTPYYDPFSFEIVPADTPPLLQRKRGAVAVISNCHAKPRKRVVAALRKHISVDWFGACEGRAWPKDSSGASLKKLALLEQYAVYLAFENSNTKYYSTEKLYGGLAGGCVTVVFGAPNSPDMAPRASILHIKNESHADAVGKQLKAMLQDPEMGEAQRLAAWHRNAAWRADWERSWGWTRDHFACRLCDTLRLRVPVATGADAGSFKALKETVSSLHAWELGRKAVVFDMGLSDWQRDQVRAWDDVAFVHAYEYHSVPADTHTIRQHALLFAFEVIGPFVWLEAGTVVEGRLKEVDRLVREQGFLFVREPGEIGEEAQAQTLQRLGLPEEKRRLRRLSTAVQGYGDVSRDVFRRVLLPVTDCLQRPECRAQSTPGAILSLIAHTSGLHIAGDEADRLVAVNRSDEIRVLALPGIRPPPNTKGWRTTIHIDLFDAPPSGKGKTETVQVQPFHPRFKQGACVKWLAPHGSKLMQGTVEARRETTMGKVSVMDTHALKYDVQGADLSVCSSAPRNGSGYLPSIPFFHRLDNATLGNVTVLPGVWIELAKKEEKGRRSLEECVFLCWSVDTCSNFWYNAQSGNCFHAGVDPPANQTQKEGPGLTSGIVRRLPTSTYTQLPAAERKEMWDAVVYSRQTPAKPTRKARPT